jgi:hypothetical protein
VKIRYRRTMQPIIVSDLTVHSVSGPTCYRGEDGFSALTAQVKTNDAALVNQLRQAADEGGTVIVRCATLEVEGQVGKQQFTSGRAKDPIGLSVDDLRYFKPRR